MLAAIVIVVACLFFLGLGLLNGTNTLVGMRLAVIELIIVKLRPAGQPASQATK